MLKNLRLYSVLALATALTFTACKKDSSDSTTDDTTLTAQLTAHTDDQQQFSDGMDDVTNDISGLVEGNAGFSGRGEGITTICGGTAVYDSTSTVRRVTITFTGANCNGHLLRQGTVVISMPLGVRWKNAGAVITVAYQNLKITRVATNKFIIINGSHQMTNVTGGLMFQLPNLQTITHTITSSGMTITFPDSTHRDWQVARQRTFTYNNGVILTVTGTHTEGTQTGIAEWGTNRFGNPFATAITQPIVWRQDCVAGITAGQITHTRMQKTAVITFGLDANGNATSCPGAGGHYYYKLVWTGLNGNTHTVINPY